MRFKIAFRNTFRNRRRTALSIAMIAGGVTAILLFEGFAKTVVTGLRETTIQTETTHLQLALPGFWDKTARSPKETLIPSYRKVITEISKKPEVSFATGRLSFFALLSKGDYSQSARGVSFDPEAERERNHSLNFTSGNPLTAKKPFQIGLGAGLAQRMRLKVGDSLTVLGYTFDGAVNAIDAEVGGIFQTAIAEFDDNTFLISLKSAQLLLNTQSVEQIVVGLKNTEFTDKVGHELTASFAPKLKIKYWWEVAKLYNQVAAFNQVQNRIVEFIILSLMALSILNTVGMSIFERMGEIGTVRALGEPAGTIILQFALEGIILGAVGGLCGLGVGTLLSRAINAMHIPLVLPGASKTLPLQIDLFFAALRDSFFLAVCAALVAAIIPAIRASRMNIAEALKRNI